MSQHYSNAKYMTIAEVIARRLRAGDFQNEKQFYSRDELARAYHISPGTARAVLRVLKDRGIIACRKGKRPVPADIADGITPPPVCRPVFFRDLRTAETPEYDYLAFCAKNLLMRQETELDERCFDPAGNGMFPALSAGSVAVVFPSAAGLGETPEQAACHPSAGCIDLRFDHTGSNAMSVFTGKAILDCALHLLRHNIVSIVHVTSGHSAFPWFRRLSSSGVLNEYIPECKAVTVPFHGELEAFPGFLAESVPAAAEPAAVLIDDPYLSDFLSGEIRVGAYCPPPWCSFFGTALNERSMVFPYLDLKLNALAASLIRTVFSKAENPSANLACEFHLIQFRNPGPD